MQVSKKQFIKKFLLTDSYDEESIVDMLNDDFEENNIEFDEFEELGTHKVYYDENWYVITDEDKVVGTGYCYELNVVILDERFPLLTIAGHESLDKVYLEDMTISTTETR